MLSKDFKTLLVLFDLKAELRNQTHLFTHDLVELLVLIVGIGREVLVEVVLGDRVHNVVCHASRSLNNY